MSADRPSYKSGPSDCVNVARELLASLYHYVS